MVYFEGQDSSEIAQASSDRYYNYPVFRFPKLLHWGDTYKATIGTVETRYLNSSGNVVRIPFSLEISLYKAQNDYNTLTLDFWCAYNLFTNSDTVKIYYYL